MGCRTGRSRPRPGWTFAFLACISACSAIVNIEDECSSDADCVAGGACIDNLCLTPMCATDADCGTGRGICEVPTGATEGLCVERPLVEIAGDISGNLMWTSENDYLLTDEVFVQPGSVLTILEDTRIYGTQTSALIFLRGARIQADGSLDNPIIFTSSQPRGQRNPGDWGGIALLGTETVNANAPDDQNGTEDLEGVVDPRAVYGPYTQSELDAFTSQGITLAPTCGVMEFVRVEFAGSEVGEGNELNGITLGGCNNQTTLDFVQVHRGLDDGIEFFGGAANLRHAVISQSGDDGLDWDFGWKGFGQFIIVQQRPESDDRSIEADSNGREVNALPRSSPQLYNMTLVADPNAVMQASQAAFLREGTAGTIANTFVFGHREGGFFFNGGATQRCLAVGFGQISDQECTTLSLNGPAPEPSTTRLIVESVVFQQLGAGAINPVDANLEEVPSDDLNFDQLDVSSAVLESANIVVLSTTNPQLANPLSVTEPDFAPVSSADIVGGNNEDVTAVQPPDDQEFGFFDSSATFIGAIPFGGEEVDWTRGWTAYPAN
ncbi:MAG: hypothetical protein ACFB9M_12050 [Myxococcota bacterium]